MYNLKQKSAPRNVMLEPRFMLRDEEIKERPALKKYKGSVPLGQDPNQLNF